MSMRVAVLFGFLFAILLAIGFLLGGIGGMAIAFAFALVINFGSYWYSSGIIIRIYRAKPTDDKELNDMAERLATNAKIPKPRVYVVPNDIPNAFATGRNPKNAIVCLTEGLLKLEKDEIEGVMAHEIGHIRNHDILISAVAATIAGAISFLAQIGYISLFFGDRRNNEGAALGLILIIIFAPLAALLIRLAISRAMEYRADYTGANLTHKPRKLASALVKINDLARHNPMRGTTATSHIWIVNPFKRDWFSSLFSTHPPIARRVKRLNEMEHEGFPERPKMIE
jgi:heat shock protein HtpX